MINIYIGVMGSGKDFYAKTHMKDSKAKNIVKLAFADAVRDITWILLNWKPENDSDYDKFKEKLKIKLVSDDNILSECGGREFLQKLGTNAIRKYMPDFWANVVKNKILEILKKEPDTDFFITDCRFLNELEILFQLDNVKVIFCNYKSSRYTINEHESEKLANDLLKQGFDDLEDITEYIKKTYIEGVYGKEKKNM